MDYNEIERKFQEQKRREFNEYVNRVSGFFIHLREAGMFCFIRFLIKNCNSHIKFKDAIESLLGYLFFGLAVREFFIAKLIYANILNLLYGLKLKQVC